MGKGNKQKGHKNVFKVAGARSLKAKNKAKSVSTQLKKLAEVTKQKTNDVDNLLGELEGTLRKVVSQQVQPKPKSAKDDKSGDKIQRFNKTQECSAEALQKLDKMTV